MPTTVASALSYLYSLTNYEVKSQFAYAPQLFDLRRVNGLLASLGDPHKRFASVHIAGTKGKGSTSAMLESILRSAGYRTGLYTSPHLHSFRERIQVSGEIIPEDSFTYMVDRLQPLAARDRELTTFEVATALAFAYFAEREIDIAVVEVGLGGRLDATNVVLPEVSVITTIGHDHMHILGHTLSEIASEKAGIIKAGVPVVSAPQEPPARAIIRQVSKERGASLHEVSRSWSWRATDWSLKGQHFTLSPRQGASADSCSTYSRLWLPLLGQHQLRNAAVATQTVCTLGSRGFPVTDQALRSGLQNLVWPGRFEILGSAPYVVVDGAHNVDSARSLARCLRQYFPEHKPWLILAILADKDVRAVMHHLLPMAEGVILSRSHHPRAADPEQLLDFARPYPLHKEIIEDLHSATSTAIDRAGPAGLVVAAGSFTTAGAVREHWLHLHDMAMPPMDPVKA